MSGNRVGAWLAAIGLVGLVQLVRGETRRRRRS
jgi:hypothetical protein